MCRPKRGYRRTTVFVNAWPAVQVAAQRGYRLLDYVLPNVAVEAHARCYGVVFFRRI